MMVSNAYAKNKKYVLLNNLGILLSFANPLAPGTSFQVKIFADFFDKTFSFVIKT